ncbi:MAG: HEPN domain-containing protein [Chloroflexi bacterium]|nr:HEPN domain-containing protein [Chloroflexota bacterium]
MRPETRNLWAQAQEDLTTARALEQSERFYACVFFCQQAAEKALKALYQHTKRKQLFTHDLLQLARGLGCSAEVERAARELTPEYVVARYPNASGTVPARLYEQADADRHLDNANKVLQWVGERLPQS